VLADLLRTNLIGNRVGYCDLDHARLLGHRTRFTAGATRPACQKQQPEGAPTPLPGLDKTTTGAEHKLR